MTDIAPLIINPLFTTSADSAPIPDCDFRGTCAQQNAQQELCDRAFTTAMLLFDDLNDSARIEQGPHSGSTIADQIAHFGSELMSRVELVDGHFPLSLRLLNVANSPVVMEPLEAERAVYVLGASKTATLNRDGQEIALRANNAYFIRPRMPYELTEGTFAVEVSACRRPQRGPGVDAFDMAGGAFDYRPFEKRSHVTSLFTTVTRLITSPNFQVERVRFMGELEQEIPYAEPVVWFVLKGSGAILFGAGKEQAFNAGDCLLLPANLPDGKLRTNVDCDWLEVTMPTASDLAEFARPDATQLQARDGTPAAPMSINIDPKLRKK